MSQYELFPEVTTPWRGWEAPTLNDPEPDGPSQKCSQEALIEDQSEVMKALLDEYPSLRIFPLASPVIPGHLQNRPSAGRGGSFHE